MPERAAGDAARGVEEVAHEREESGHGGQDTPRASR